MIGTFVVVRTYSAGVHCGVVASWDGGKVVTLQNARRIWRWYGANTLNEVSQKGVEQTRSRISEPVAATVLTEAIEIITCSDIAKENLSISRWGH